MKIMAAKVGADAADYAKNVPGTHFLTLAEAKAAFKKGDGLDSIYGSMTVGNKFNLDNKVYKVTQKPESYLVPGIVDGPEVTLRIRAVATTRTPWRSCATGSDLKAGAAAPAAARADGAVLSCCRSLLWCAVSYVPWLWHPLVHVTAPGDVDYFVGGHGCAARGLRPRSWPR